jgi:predicted nucleic acid-binding protein
MKPSARFIDTNVLLYLLSADQARADRAEATLAGGGIVSVQVLNEFASVASRKLGMSIGEIRETLTTVREVCSVVPLNEETHDLGLQIVERYGMSIYDAMVVASALIVGCDELLSEDLQDGQIIEDRLRIRNPFSGPTG